MKAGLSLRQRLIRAAQIGLVLSLWALPKVAWEQHLTEEQNVLRTHGVPITVELRDQMGQGLAIGLLSGMRAVVADVLWLETVEAWKDQNWFRLSQEVHLCTTLQPRSVSFWEQGARYLAWDAAFGSLNQKKGSEYLRLRAFRYWVQEGQNVLKRGLENNPDSYRLWQLLATLQEQHLKDYRSAAYSYERASRCPGAPIFLERFGPYMNTKAGDDVAAYEAWKALWLRLTPEDRQNPQHWAERIMSTLTHLEDKLKIPREKRIFPK